MKRLILIALALPLYLECGPASVPPDARADLAPLPFKKAAVAAIEVASLPPRSTGLLHWFLTPGQLRAIAAGGN